LKNGKVVDIVKVGRYANQELKELVQSFGLKRDDSQTWEKKDAEEKLGEAFKTSGQVNSEL
jgi:hypothetical protein